MSDLTERQRELARHALGLPNRRRKSYRNHFVAGEDHDDYVEWMTMVATDAARKTKGNAITGGDDLFRLTLYGARLALKPGETLDAEDFPHV